jgi:tetratricopeptide (TPR) repeat protein
MNDDPHNYLLNLLVSGGVGLFAGFVLMLFGSLKLLWIKSKDKENGYLYLAAFISLIVWIINAQFNPIEVSGMYVLGILFGLSLSGNIQEAIGIKSGKLKLLGIASLLIATSFILGDICLNLGLLSYNNKNVELAYRYFHFANMVSPGTRVISALATMTQIQVLPETFEEAVYKYRSIHPEYGETNYWLGNFYMNKYLATNDGKYLDQSINYFKEAALDAPFSDSSVKYYAQSLIEKGNYNEAAMVVKQWVTKKPENFDAWNVLAKVYQRQKKVRPNGMGA